MNSVLQSDSGSVSDYLFILWLLMLVTVVSSHYLSPLKSGYCDYREHLKSSVCVCDSSNTLDMWIRTPRVIK